MDSVLLYFRYSCWHTFSFCFGVYVLNAEALTPKAPGWTRLLVQDFDLSWYWFPTVAEVKLLGSKGWPMLPVSSIMKTYYLTGSSYVGFMFEVNDITLLYI